MNKYIGHTNQIYGVEQMRLEGGKGDGMRMLIVRNACGLEFSVSLDRCADIVKLSFKGVNYSYFAPCGYVSPQYYDKDGIGFLKSFSAGFITTCGLTAVGNPCVDDGEQTGLHGTVSNTPCENFGWHIENDNIIIKAWVRDASLFGHQLVLEREYTVPVFKNEIHMTDTIRNISSRVSPIQVLYHCNMGYPLLSENAQLTIPAESVTPRNEHSASGIDNCLVVEKPQSDFEEMCFYHNFKGNAEVTLYNPDIKKGLIMRYNADNMKYFTQWKMMGIHEYVMGLEPGNCNPDGRDIMRADGTLEFINPDETRTFNLSFEFTE